MITQSPAELFETTLTNLGLLLAVAVVIGLVAGLILRFKH